MPSQSQSLLELYPFRSRDLIWAQLRNLVITLEARFQAVEEVQATYDQEIEQFETVGIDAINQSLTPLVQEAILRLKEATTIFSAVSGSTNTIGLGTQGFFISGSDRLTFAPLSWVSAYAQNQPVGSHVGMLGRVDYWNPDTGELIVFVVALDGGEGDTFTGWNIATSPPVSLGAVNVGEMDAAISAAVSAALLQVASDLSALDALIDAKAPINSPALTGTPTLDAHPSTADDTSRIATTHFTQLAAAAAAAAAVAGFQGLAEASVNQVRAATQGAFAIVTEHINTASAVVALTDAATVLVDWTAFINGQVTLGGNRTLGNPANGIPGTWHTILVVQDSNGTRTLGYGNQYVYLGSAPVIAIGNGAKTRLTIFCRTTSIFEVYASVGLTG